MDKRTFLKTSTALVGGSLLGKLAACTSPKEHLSNWAGNLQYSTANVYRPSSVEEVRELVARLPRLRALGSRHCFNTIADSEDNLVSSERLNRIVSLDRERHTVTVEGGIRYGELVEFLHDNGYALHNLASLPHISVAGSIATATHGSGVGNGNLATSVSGLEFVNASGELVRLSRNDGDTFNGAVVGLGMLGFVTKVTLDLLPTFVMKQVVYQNMPMAALEKNFSEIMSAGYSVSLFTDWRNRNINEVWIKSRVDGTDGASPGNEFFGANAATQNLHPVESQPAESCTEQLGVPGPWYERLPHFKMGFTPSAGVELQSEYFVPLENAYEAFMAVEALHEAIAPFVLISEIRTVAADDLWMSPCYGKPCVAIHTTWKQEWDRVIDLLPRIEEQLSPFGARPHWGKLFTMQPSVLQGRIERLNDFLQLVKRHDPEGKFRNGFVERNLYSSGTPT